MKRRKAARIISLRRSNYALKKVRAWRIAMRSTPFSA
jgi:hypothetical protein